LLRIQEVAILVTVFDLLFTRNNALTRTKNWRCRDRSSRGLGDVPAVLFNQWLLFITSRCWWWNCGIGWEEWRVGFVYIGIGVNRLSGILRILGRSASCHD